jgi:plasmid stabilization system protein ParE
MKEARRMLERFPDAGSRMHGLQIAGGRTLVIGNYLFDYLRDGDVVDVLAIRHARMNVQTPDVALDEDLSDDPEG